MHKSLFSMQKPAHFVYWSSSFTNLLHFFPTLFPPVWLVQWSRCIYVNFPIRVSHVTCQLPAFFFCTADTRGCTWSLWCSRDRPSARSACRLYCSRPGSWRNGTLWSWNALPGASNDQRSNWHLKHTWKEKRIGQHEGHDSSNWKRYWFILSLGLQNLRKVQHSAVVYFVISRCVI